MSKILDEPANSPPQPQPPPLLLLLLLLTMMNTTNGAPVQDTATKARVSSSTSSLSAIQQMEFIKKNATYSERACKNLALWLFYRGFTITTTAMGPYVVQW